jgi:exopolysaccharide biosynthesis polyprenyl glycosylphosphotransferase
MSLLDTRSATSTETALEPGATRASEAPHGAPPPLALDGPDSSNLKLVLIMIDVVAASSAWLLWAAFADVKPDAYLSGPLRAAVLAVALTLLSLGGFRLYRARVCSVHAVEIAGIGKASAIAAIGVQAFEGAIGVDTEPLHLAAGAVAVFLALLTGRRGFRTWIARRRRRGQHLRPVVVVGTNDEGRALVAMLRRNPDAGYAVVGLLGDRHGVANTGIVPWLGQAHETAEVVRGLGANGAFFAASALAPDQLNDSVRELMADGSHVHLSSSLRGIDARRIRLQPISRELMFYLEPARLRRWEERTKRVIDITFAGLGLVLSAPLLLALALAVRLHDGGSPLFRQVRVGRGGTHFTLLKLRTMIPDAERHVSALASRNERDGVLFKVDDDPRVTPIGRFLRAVSLDELPQLINVLRGEMSLVGPRPALPSEVAQFEERLLARHLVTPGVTGLWQVEAREVPGLGAYTRLDLFYVENWSVMLDLAIMISTVSAVLGRAARLLLRRAPATT